MLTPINHVTFTTGVGLQNGYRPTLYNLWLLFFIHAHSKLNLPRPILLTWINYNPSMDKWSYAQLRITYPLKKSTVAPFDSGIG